MPLRRSVHFVPAGSLGRVEKVRGKADVVVIDLEDAVAPSRKQQARAELADWLRTAHWGAGELLVRINDLETDWWQADLAATLCPGNGLPHGYMVPKVRDAAQLRRVAAELDRLEGGGKPQRWLLPICTELPEAVFRLPEIAKASGRVQAITWGCEDLSAEIGASRTRDEQGNYLPVFEMVRAHTLLAAKAAGVLAIDGVYTSLRNARGLLVECDQAVQMGFDGKMTIHPQQLPLVHSAFTASPAQLEEARALVASAAGQSAGAWRFRGRMVDGVPCSPAGLTRAAAPHLVQAKRLLEASAELPVGEPEAPVRLVPHTGRWFEELEIGQRFDHAIRRTVTETDNVLFSTATMNPAALHLDYQAALTLTLTLTPRLPGGPALPVRTAAGQLYVHDGADGWALGPGPHPGGSGHAGSAHAGRQGTSVAQLALNDARFVEPVFCGDTIRVRPGLGGADRGQIESSVKSKRELKTRPADGVVEFEHRAFNQYNQLVCTATRVMMVRKMPAARPRL